MHTFLHNPTSALSRGQGLALKSPAALASPYEPWPRRSRHWKSLRTEAALGADGSFHKWGVLSWDPYMRDPSALDFLKLPD